MASFPKLKTGVVAQYPVVRESGFSTVVKRYLDNSEQRFRDARALRRRWVVALSKLNESEAAELMNFFVERQGRFGVFDFEDPWTGLTVSGCRFDRDRLPLNSNGELDLSAEMTIVEPAT